VVSVTDTRSVCWQD